MVRSLIVVVLPGRPGWLNVSVILGQRFVCERTVFRTPIVGIVASLA